MQYYTHFMYSSKCARKALEKRSKYAKKSDLCYSSHEEHPCKNPAREMKTHTHTHSNVKHKYCASIKTTSLVTILPEGKLLPPLRSDVGDGEGRGAGVVEATTFRQESGARKDAGQKDEPRTMSVTHAVQTTGARNSTQFRSSQAGGWRARANTESDMGKPFPFLLLSPFAYMALSRPCWGSYCYHITQTLLLRCPKGVEMGLWWTTHRHCR